jgi:hypothetical protein
MQAFLGIAFSIYSYISISLCSSVLLEVAHVLICIFLRSISLLTHQLAISISLEFQLNIIINAIGFPYFSLTPCYPCLFDQTTSSKRNKYFKREKTWEEGKDFRYYKSYGVCFTLCCYSVKTVISNTQLNMSEYQ